MREIKFRGKRLDDGEWVCGHLADVIIGVDKFEDRAIINLFGTALAIACDPATVGQYTGLKDTNGKEIYEGDSISGSYGIYGLEFAGIIEPVIGGFVLRCPNGGYLTFGDFHRCDIHIIGNIHDNPELLK